MNNDSKHTEPIRIIVKKKKHSGHHGGAWKVAYADFVTAMMALFIVLWIVGQSNAIKKAISMYFTNPSVFSGGTGVLHESSRTSSKIELTPEQVIKQKNGTESEIKKLFNEGKKIERLIGSNPVFAKFRDKVLISVTKEGLKIELIEDSKGLFFDIGSAKVKPETVKLLKLIAVEIGRLPNNVIIEGHADARPYVSKVYSNWELSVDRANAARNYLEENGLRKKQIIEIRGYADRKLKLPDKPLDHINRRVNIIVTLPKQAKSENMTSTTMTLDEKNNIIPDK